MRLQDVLTLSEVGSFDENYYYGFVYDSLSSFLDTYECDAGQAVMTFFSCDCSPSHGLFSAQRDPTSSLDSYSRIGIVFDSNIACSKLQ